MGFRDFFRGNSGASISDADAGIGVVAKEVGEGEGEPVSRDLFLSFCAARRKGLVVRLSQLETVEANLKLLILEEARKSREVEPKRTVKQTKKCELCLNITPNILLCRLCAASFCKKCSQETISLANSAIQLPICSACNYIYSIKKDREQWDQRIDDAEKYELVTCFSVLGEIEFVIEKLLPQYETEIQTIMKSNMPPIVEDLPESIKNLKKMEAHLTRFFDNYELGLGKIRKYRSNTVQEKRVQTNLLSGKNQKLKNYYPKFRILKAELRNVTPKISYKPLGSTLTPNQTMKEEPPIISPVIFSIEPSTLSLKGGDMVIRGEHFFPTAKIYINGLETPTTCLGETILYCLAPAYPFSGEVPVFVRNPDADSDPVSLIYVDEDENICVVQDKTSANFIAGSGGWGHDPYAPTVPTIPVKSKKMKSFAMNSPPRVWGNSPFVEEEEKTPVAIDPLQAKPIILEKDMYRNSSPSISTIDPILAPLTGIPITITGYKFAKEVQIQIGNVILEGKTSYSITSSGKIECSVSCRSPVLGEGFHSVVIKNPKGNQVCLDNILVYIPEKKWLEITHSSAPVDSIQDTSTRSSRSVWG